MPIMGMLITSFLSGDVFDTVTMKEPLSMHAVLVGLVYTSQALPGTCRPAQFRARERISTAAVVVWLGNRDVIQWRDAR